VVTSHIARYNYYFCALYFAPFNIWNFTSWKSLDATCFFSIINIGWHQIWIDGDWYSYLLLNGTNQSFIYMCDTMMSSMSSIFWWICDYEPHEEANGISIRNKKMILIGQHNDDDDSTNRRKLLLHSLRSRILVIRFFWCLLLVAIHFLMSRADRRSCNCSVV
jgi:hypothetical protein